MIISVNNPYFDEMKFCLNNSSVYIEPQNTMQRPMMGQQGMMGQRPMAGRPQSGMAGQRPMMNQPGMNQRPMAGRPQSGMTQRPMMGQMNSVGRMNTMAAGFDRESNQGISRKYREMGDEIRARRCFRVMGTARGGGAVQTAPMQQKAPMQQQETFAPAPAAAGPWTCPACGGQNDEKALQYCGAPPEPKRQARFWAGEKPDGPTVYPPQCGEKNFSTHSASARKHGRALKLETEKEG